MAGLFKDYKPLPFFSIVAAFIMLISIIILPKQVGKIMDTLLEKTDSPLFLLENGLAVGNKVMLEVMALLAAVWLMLGSLFYSLQLNTGSFPRPLSVAEEEHYLKLAQEGDLEARNVLIERNLRLVAHIMNKG